MIKFIIVEDEEKWIKEYEVIINDILFKTDKEYEVFELKLEGFSYQEMSCLLGVSLKSIDGSIRRIKSKLTNLK